MKHARSLSIALSVCTLVGSIVWASGTPARAAMQQASGSVSDDPTFPLFTQMCSKCHDQARVVATRRNKFEWEEVINKMIEKGAMGTEKDFENVYDFLLRNYGKVDVNRCASDELVMILGVTDKDAQAIVAYRKANGNFADFDALLKVPDVDAKKLEAHRDAVSF